MQDPITLKDIIITARTPSILKRSVKVALVVGTILMAINHGDALLMGEVEPARIGKILLTYLVPFCVSTQASVLATLNAQKTQQPSL